jgi:hypothetical protein
MTIFLFLLQNLPSILQAVIGIEAAVKAPGATKKAMVMNSLAIAAKVGEAVPETHVAAISAAIDSIVSSLNAAGVFKSAPALSGASSLMAALKPPVSA